MAPQVRIEILRITSETPRMLETGDADLAVQRNVRPRWLRNPETGRNLELDMYCPDLRLACEYNGSQHYHESELHRPGSDDFRRQQRRDRLKKRLCERHGVRLIVVPFTQRHRLEAFLREHIEARG